MSNGTQGGRSLDAHKIEAANVGFHTSFNNRLGKAESVFRKLATVVETSDLIDRQVWITSTPKMRRWVGDKVLTKLRAESHPILTYPHEASLEIPKHDLLNDKLGLWSPKINQIADAYGEAIDELVIAMLAAGTTGTSLGACYDGQNLLDSDHTALSIGGTSQSNIVDGALDADAYAEAWEKYRGIKDENGVPVNVAGRRMTLVVGPANAVVAREILTQTFGTGGVQNLDAGSADLIITPWLSAGTLTIGGTSVTVAGTEWFLIPENSSAILVHIKRTPEFLAVESGEFSFRTGKYLYGIEAEFGAAYGLWQEIVGGDGVA
jgi:phage major head subunit gpT-like protein